jgi:hypothetical protein
MHEEKFTPNLASLEPKNITIWSLSVKIKIWQTLRKHSIAEFCHMQLTFLVPLWNSYLPQHLGILQVWHKITKFWILGKKPLPSNKFFQCMNQTLHLCWIFNFGNNINIRLSPLFETRIKLSVPSAGHHSHHHPITGESRIQDSFASSSKQRPVTL